VPYGARAPRRGGLLPWLAWGSIVMTAVLVAGCLSAYAAYRKLYGNITHESVTGKLGKRPPKIGKATNVLVLGSDSRSGKDAKYGKADGERSDTLIVLHLSPDGKQAVGMSFPRDSMVQLPSCKTTKGGTAPAHLGMINEAFSEGGPACSWKTIESLTGVHIDHFVKVDFSGFKGMVNALGGVEVCLPTAVHDRDSHLDLSAGRHIVKGEQALAYVRNRHGLGDGSDLGRIKRQQLFMSSIVKKVTDGGLLASPTKLFNFLDAATKSVTTDDGLDISEIKKLAGSVQGMSAGKVKFVTVPNEAYPADPNRVQFAQPLAGQLFDAIKNDNIAKADNSVKKKSTTTPAKPTIPAAQIQVRVLNGTGHAGLAATVADALKAKGFKVVKVGNTPKAGVTKSTLRYGPSGAKAMPTLQQDLKTVTPKSVSSLHTGRLDLVIGNDWGGLKGGDIPSNIGGVQANTNICKSN
jgi:LCP family protein required for cell wall assembly